MKKHFIVGLLIAGAIIAGIMVRQTRNASAALPSIDDESAVWVEVVAKPVMRVRDGNRTELRTGDRLEAGDTVRVGEEGFARVYFPDGSNMDVDAGTELTLKEATYGEHEETFVVRISLLVGSVWSRVVGLTTPDSQWSVETSNAVVTVRGTTFGVSHEDETTTEIVGGENEVAVTASADSEAVSEGEYVVLTTATSGERHITKDEVPQEARAKRWIRRGLRDDAAFKQLRQTLRDEQGLRGRALRRAMRQHVRELVIRRLRGELDEAPLEDVPLDASEPVIDAPQDAVQTPEPSVLVPPSPVRLAIMAKSALENVREGDTVLFEAVVYFADGTSRPVTKDAAWSASGGIGTFTAPGVFVADLDDVAAELGKVPGGVSATVTTPSGSVIIGTTDAFFVYPNVTVDIEQRG